MKDKYSEKNIKLVLEKENCRFQEKDGSFVIYQCPENHTNKTSMYDIIRRGNCCNNKNCINLKRERTSIKRYGVKRYNNREKYKETISKKYGEEIENVSQVKSIIDKVKKTWQDKTESDISTILEKRKETNREKYEVDYGFQSESVKEKIRKTKLDKYGDEYYSNPEQTKETWKTVNISDMKSKSKETCLTRYGDENFNNPDKSKETCLEKYGVEHPLQNNDIFDKVIKSGYRRKLVTTPSGKIIYLQGYEPRAYTKLLETYTEDEIKHGIEDIPKIWYNGLDDKKHRYYPDFYIPKDNLIIEVKSVYTYECNLEVNKLKQQSCLDMGYNFKFEIL